MKRILAIAIAVALAVGMVSAAFAFEKPICELNWAQYRQLQEKLNVYERKYGKEIETLKERYEADINRLNKRFKESVSAVANAYAQKIDRILVHRNAVVERLERFGCTENRDHAILRRIPPMIEGNER